MDFPFEHHINKFYLAICNIFAAVNFMFPIQCGIKLVLNMWFVERKEVKLWFIEELLWSLLIKHGATMGFDVITFGGKRGSVCGCFDRHLLLFTHQNVLCNVKLAFNEVCSLLISLAFFHLVTIKIRY